jgi:predicted DNA-binding transcriptional regulator
MSVASTLPPFGLPEEQIRPRGQLRSASMDTSDDRAVKSGRAGWTFLTNHGHVLLCIFEDPGIRGRDIAERVGITERAAQAIIADLVDQGYLTRTRVGRRNSYSINSDRPLRHAVEAQHTIGELLQLLGEMNGPAGTP